MVEYDVERTAVLLKQYEIWKKERAQFLHSKGDLSWEDRNAAIKDFWNSREAQIDQLTEEAQNAQANFRKKNGWWRSSRPRRLR